MRTLTTLLLAASFSLAAAPALAGTPDTVGTVDPATGIWALRNEEGHTARFYYGNPGDAPMMGDWDCDGVDTPGLYRQSDGYVYLRNSNTQGVADIRFFFGNPGDVPLAGDFDGDGCDTVSIWRPSEGRVFVINELGANDGGLGPAEFDYYFGNPGDEPFVGDFDGDGVDTVGLYRRSTGFVYFRNSNAAGVADVSYYYGDPGDRILSGDWDGDGDDTAGIYRPDEGTFYLRNSNTQGVADTVIPAGAANLTPVAGAFGDIAAIPDIGLAEVVGSGLNQPLFLTAPPGDDRLFIVEKGGSIRIVADGNLLTAPFLTIPGITTDGERGLLGLAFHPGYAGNGRFFVNYTDGAGDTQIVEYHADPASNVADPTPVRTILSIDQPYPNHNGGMIAFGPDGFLYIGMGDGGSGGDPDENGEDPTTLLGAMLRIDVDSQSPYAIPAGNPYDGTNGAREVWITGVRNPWRWSFDRSTGELYIGDVGQNEWEEIDVVPAGVGGIDLGWDRMEGLHCFEPSSGCDTTGLTMPVLEYGHGEGNSVTGGYVYRGSAIPGLAGTYFYGDFGAGWIRSFTMSGGVAADQRDWTSVVGTVPALASFGEDSAGELYVVSIAGKIYKIVGTS